MASRQLPGRAVATRKKFARVGIAQDYFLGGVPFDLPTDQHRDEAEVAGNGRVVRSLHRRNRRLAGLYTVQEVAMVAV